jgi:hypothetical protein
VRLRWQLCSRRSITSSCRTRPLAPRGRRACGGRPDTGCAESFLCGAGAAAEQVEREKQAHDRLSTPQMPTQGAPDRAWRSFTRDCSSVAAADALVLAAERQHHRKKSTVLVELENEPFARQREANSGPGKVELLRVIENRAGSSCSEFF